MKPTNKSRGGSKSPFVVDSILPTATALGVNCAACGKWFPMVSSDFVVFYGNVTIGRCGGIEGNHFDENGKLKRAGVYCRNLECCKHIADAIGYTEEED